MSRKGQPLQDISLQEVSIGKDNSEENVEEKEQHSKRYVLEKKSSSYLDDQPHTVWKRESKQSLERVMLQERRN